MNFSNQRVNFQLDAQENNIANTFSSNSNALPNFEPLNSKTRAQGFIKADSQNLSRSIVQKDDSLSRI
jgi:hypothetical protein